MKRTLVILMAMLLLCTTWVPALATAESTELRQNKDAATTIRVFTWGYPAEKLAREQQAQLYMDTHPDVNILVEVSPDYDRKLAAMLNSGDGPDVFETSDDWFHLWQDELTDLNEFVKRDGMKVEEIFEPRALAGFWTPEGKLESLPIGLCPTIMAVNKDLFAAAGVEVPSGKWTWEDARDIAIKLTSGEGADKVYGFADNWMYDQLVPYFTGGSYYSEDRKSIVANSPESVAGLQFYHELIHKYKVYPDFNAAAGVQGNQRFYAGKAAMVPINMWDILDFVSQIGDAFDWDLIMMPSSSVTGKVQLWSIVEGYGIWEGSNNKEAAWEYIKWATTDPAALKLSAIAAVPLAKDGAKLVVEQDFGRKLDLQKFADAVQFAILTQPGGAFQEVNDIISENINDLKKDARSIEEIVKSIVEQAQPALDRAWM